MSSNSPAICIGCGCNELHACEHAGAGCWWLRFEAESNTGVCSRCQDLVQLWSRGERAPQLELISERFARQVQFLYGEETSAIAWINAAQLGIFGGKSARELILAGELEHVRDVVEQIRAGAHV